MKIDENKLLDCIGHVGDDLVAESETEVFRGAQLYRRPGAWVSAAAAFVLLAVGLYLVTPDLRVGTYTDGQLAAEEWGTRGAVAGNHEFAPQIQDMAPRALAPPGEAPIAPPPGDAPVGPFASPPPPEAAAPPEGFGFRTWDTDAGAYDSEADDAQAVLPDREMGEAVLPEMATGIPMLPVRAILEEEADDARRDVRRLILVTDEPLYEVYVVRLTAVLDAGQIYYHVTERLFFSDRWVPGVLLAPETYLPRQDETLLAICFRDAHGWVYFITAVEEDADGEESFTVIRRLDNVIP